MTAPRFLYRAHGYLVDRMFRNGEPWLPWHERVALWLVRRALDAFEAMR